MQQQADMKRKEQMKTTTMKQASEVNFLRNIEANANGIEREGEIYT
jgi:hypothetical protein